ncbi:hypothetical protein EMPS_08981 [Entomortierella parvispora]|uniref:Uncharacterized protein n=1 Tax=Entomortierella parvispora TaxID=205924 RepID=A0A9P3HBH5_9FUNG|nr:hypothetical protein EMPS_05796 [Entomortierella parvispora]GJJ76622.1 hypothetical protein EMPS_08981 [Entomortierella parvispora]
MMVRHVLLVRNKGTDSTDSYIQASCVSNSHMYKYVYLRHPVLYLVLLIVLTSSNMPRGACTYGYCALGLLPPAEPKTKNQKNHVAGYHVDNPIKFMCGYTDRQVTFSRIPTKHMDFVCYCGLTFTLNSSIHRHYHYCAVARDAALNAIAHPPPPGAGGAGDGNGVIVAPAPPSTALVVAERSVGEHSGGKVD